MIKLSVTVHSKHKLDYVQHFNMFISPRHPLDFGKKKKKTQTSKNISILKSEAYTKRCVEDSKDEGFGSVVVVVKIVTFKEGMRHS